MEIKLKKYNYWIQKRLKFIIWFVILLGCIYILIRFAALSFSYDMGQAHITIREVIASKISIRAFESGFSFMEFAASTDKAKAYSYLADLAADKFSIYEFTREKGFNKTMANENHTFMQQDLIYNTEAEREKDFNTKYETSESKSTEETAQLWKPWTFMGAASGNGILSKEYILSNGIFVISSNESEAYSNDGVLDIENENNNDIQTRDVYYGDIEDETKLVKEDNLTETMRTSNGLSFSPDQLMDLNFLIRNFYIVDPTTKVIETLFDVKKLLSKDMTFKKKNNSPQILIYHTHSQEAYIDSRKGKESDTVVGVGTYLAKILEEQYGYNVIHDKTKYDLVDGVLERSLAYNYANVGLEKNLSKYPSVEVVIDLHRDGSSNKRIININGKETAQIMLFNGLCRDQNGPLTNFDNQYLQDNIAFSLQLQLKSLETYPGLFFKNYLKCWRYNLHLRPKSILMELGTNQNTLQSAKNAMKPFAKVLDAVLQGK
jgi:stage II sporulation protein P